MKQQSKNLRTNLSILNQLNRKYSIKAKNVVAMDFIVHKTHYFPTSKNHLEKLAAEATEGFEVRLPASRLKGVTRLRVHHEEAPCEVPRVMFSPKSKTKRKLNQDAH
ncbi:hypothetical protein G6F46_001734 [Rhizopus delemar]|uniref:Uncharacterized protein n=2 Tax=Rhizopus TaxID=4842 RepID=A0A9P7CKB2_9FUNG|nr:hypothetical protein G6F55_009619 [Rhizopus delemar]KAG1537172.1 hypothetical protein G6F51_010534 [Rhizopus arrhizus]KAG1493444.1 hypothetical protein G6F54_008573 [Rhizopus delemar]KAG1505954.1 hypothetical protein G6F53_010040 [Rhizopus delemar]KAG1523662.1 hypothetical protein G6F52_004841 [Rhizopus delemar]